MDKFLVPMIGSFLGFFLGLISLVLKDRLDLNKRVELFRVTALFFAENLRTYLHDDPALFSGIDIKVVNNCLDGVRSKDLRKIYHELFTFYTNWSRGCYIVNGIKFRELNATRDKLAEIIQFLTEYQAHSIWHFWK
jgi:hypothetical protein